MISSQKESDLRMHEPVAGQSNLSIAEPGRRPSCHSRGFAMSIKKGGGTCVSTSSNTRCFFETMSKRRKGFPSERKVKRGVRVVHGEKELSEKLGRNDLCPCESGKLLKNCCLKSGCF